MKIYKGNDITLNGIQLANFYTDSACEILIGKEGNSVKRWHMSISHNSRYPTWDEIKQARYALLPRDRGFAMLLPPQDEYVNVHPNCFHLWEYKKNELKYFYGVIRSSSQLR